MPEYKKSASNTFERLSGAFCALENEINLAASYCDEDINTRSELLLMISVLQGMYTRIDTEIDQLSRKEFLRVHPPSAAEKAEIREWLLARKTPWWTEAEYSKRGAVAVQTVEDEFEKKRLERKALLQEPQKGEVIQ